MLLKKLISTAPLREAKRYCYSLAGWLFIGLLVLTIQLLLPRPALAQGPVVNTITDEHDGSCSDDDCSLRDAIARADPGDTITFDAALAGQTITLSSQLNISKTLTIDGSGRAITISGDTDNDGEGNVRVLWLDSSAVATLTHLSIVGGYITGDGGGIYNSGTLTVQNSTFSGNTTTPGMYGSGGGIYNSGTLTVIDSTFSGNTAGSAGGGIYNNNGMLTVIDSTFSGNTAFSAGGGIYNSYGTLTVTDSIFSDNPGNDAGGGIYNSGGMLTVTNSTFSGNSGDAGGGIHNNQGTLTVTNSTFSNNWSVFLRGSGGGIYNSGGMLTVTNSTFSGNWAFFGGGISNSGSSTLTVQNSTFSNNRAQNFSMYGSGGGIYNNGTLTVQNSTFSGNTAIDGGGIYNSGTLALTNTIIANSLSGGDCRGSVSTHGYNLIESTGADACSLTNGVDGNLIGVDPLLGELGNYGGNTPTFPLLAGSPALNTSSACLSTDQRGIARPQGAACDMGAFELAAAMLSLGKTVIPAGNVPYHGLVTYTLVLSNTGADSDPAVVLTDTLPTQLDFARWVGIPPSGAAANNNQITWSGALSSSAALTFTFQATHTGTYAETITNTAEFSASAQIGSDEAGFTVVGMPWRSVYLPLVVKSTP